MDGDFTPEHLRMRRPDDDVALTDGSGMMTGTSRYEAHLKVAKESRLVCILLQTMPVTNGTVHRNPPATTIGPSTRPMWIVTG